MSNKLRPQLRELRAIRDEHRDMKLSELHAIALHELIRIHAVIDELTWGEVAD